VAHPQCATGTPPASSAHTCARATNGEWSAFVESDVVATTPRNVGAASAHASDQYAASVPSTTQTARAPLIRVALFSRSTTFAYVDGVVIVGLDCDDDVPSAKALVRPGSATKLASCTCDGEAVRSREDALRDLVLVRDRLATGHWTGTLNASPPSGISGIVLCLEDGGVRFGDRDVRLEDGGVRLEDEGVRLEDEGVRSGDGGVRLEDEGVRFGDGGVRLEDGGVRFGYGGVRFEDEGVRFGESDAL
jgi:hypothetical protein